MVDFESLCAVEQFLTHLVKQDDTESSLKFAALGALDGIEDLKAGVVGAEAFQSFLSILQLVYEESHKSLSNDLCAAGKSCSVCIELTKH